jgi:DNA-binding transcriptional MerR regulator
VVSRDWLVPIGRFARSCRLSIKALRHWDEQGLLVPAHVDVGSGYRYYSRAQAPDALAIGMLRSLGLGLPAIRAILAAPPAERGQLLTAEANRMARELARREHALGAIQRLTESGSLWPYEISIRHEEPIVVARRQVETSVDDLVPDTTALVYALMAELRDAGREPRMPILCMNGEPDAEERFVAHACAAFDPPAPPLPHGVIDELPGGPMAWLTHRGSYEELGVAYHALHAWVQEHGHEPRSLVREIYLNDPADVPPEALLTELWLPVG